MRCSRVPPALPPLALLLLALACAPARSPRPGAALDPIAVAYVKLALAMEKHDADFVDAYYGPPAWRDEAKRDSIPLPAIRARADSLIASLDAHRPAKGDTLAGLRHRYLRRQLEALEARVRLLSGERMTYDQESQALYDAVAPACDDSRFAPALARLDSLLPGRGPLAARYEKFRAAFVIPPAKLDTVFRAAIREARRRTRAHLALPDSESFTVAYVTGQPWSGYNWYRGGYHSLIQVNVDLPVHIEQALGLACHEGYPGHHVYNAVIESSLVRARGWVEFSVFPLFSPSGLIAEGSGNVAPEVAFPGDERLRFEKEVLYPLAGLDSSLAARYQRVREAVNQLDLAGIECARRYLDGRLTREQAVRWLMTHQLRTRERAERSIRFDERYRSYTINYGLGEAMVRNWLAANGGDDAHPERRWQLFHALLAEPRLPADLRVNRQSVPHAGRRSRPAAAVRDRAAGARPGVASSGGSGPTRTRPASGRAPASPPSESRRARPRPSPTS